MAVATTKAERQQQLDWERTWRPRGAIGAALAAILSIAGIVYSIQALSDRPAASLLQSLSNLEQAGPIGETRSVKAANFQYLSDHTGEQILLAVILALGTIATAIALMVLVRATIGRAERFPRWAKHLPIAGGGLYALGQVLVAVGNGASADDLLSGPLTVDAVDGAEQNVILVIGAVGLQFGMLLLGLAFVLACLHAMRAGLLTRTWGILGIVAGAAVVIPVGLSQMIQPIFLAGLALVFLGQVPRPRRAPGLGDGRGAALAVRRRGGAAQARGPPGQARRRRPARPRAGRAGRAHHDGDPLVVEQEAQTQEARLVGTTSPWATETERHHE